MIKTYFKINVIGTLWQGSKATYTKTFENPPDNINSVLRGFGDFSDITDFQVIKFMEQREVVGSVKHTHETEEVITEWTLPDSQDKFWNLN